uniref:VPS9 domain-containing 1 n=1 Tax=Xenopus tropicalis TaxID=8364 RepID=A0A803JVF7_XENTR
MRHFVLLTCPGGGAVTLPVCALANCFREAYVEYIRSVNYISQCLLEEAEQNAGSGSLSLDCQKMLKLAEQCLERACTTAERLGQAGVHCPLTLRTDVHHLSFPHASSAASATSRLSSLSSISPSSSHRRTCSDETQKLSSFPPPEIFQMLLAAEVQRGKKELTPLEEASIQNQKLKAAYEVRLARLNPRQAAAKTSLTLSLQRQMMENLVIAKAREETLQRKAEERRQRLKEESNRRFSLNTDMTPEMEEQRVLYTAVLEYEQDHEWPKRFKQKIKGNPADTDLVSSFMCQVLSTPDHPVSKLLTNLQCQIYSRVYPVIIKDPMEHNHGTSDVFHQSLPTDALPSPASNSQHLKSSQSLQCLPSLLQPSVKHSLSTGEGFEHLEATNDKLIDKGPCDKERENSFEDLEHCLSPTEYSIGNASLTASALLKAVVKEIHNAKDLLLSASLLDLPPNTIFKDVCVECIDESFFPPIWPALLALYRHVLLAREESLLQAMKSYRDNAQSVVGVPQKLFPEEVEQPYKAAVEEIGHLPLHHTPQRKMECIVRTMRVICECAEEYCTTPGTSAIGADDLLPILAFVVLKTQMPQLLSECAALEEFIHEGYLIGEDGYCLTSLLSALSYVESLPLLSAPST